jgi:hypothetical protein
MYKNMLSGQQAAATYIPNKLGQKPVDVRKNLTAVNRDVANLEAEGGETVLIPNKDGGPAHYTIKGNRHFQGGVPLAIPPESFIFSDTKSMKIKDPVLLEEFGMPEKKGGYTPAEIAKRYDINTYRKVLADPNSDALQINTAEKVIANYNVKLGKLALIQESMKSFPGGIPTVALPYTNKYNLDPSLFLPTDPSTAGQQILQEEMMEGAMSNPQEEMMEQPIPMEGMPMGQRGGQANRLRQFANGGQPGEEEINPRIARRAERRARRDAERQHYNQVYNTILQEILMQDQQEKQMKLANKPDPRTGLYLHRNDDGTVYYTDGNGVRIENFDKAYNPSVTRTTTEPELKEGESIVVKNGKRYIVKKVTKPAVADKSKIKPKAEATKSGDIYEEDGKYYQVEGYDESKILRSTQSTGIENYPGGEAQLTADKAKADTILKRLEEKGLAIKQGTGWNIRPGARKEMTTAEKEFLTDFFSRGNKPGVIGLGVDGYNVVKQGEENGFYGYTNPDFYEYRYYKAKNPTATPDQWDALSANEKLTNRKAYLYALGFDLNDPHIAANINNPSKLYTKAFVEGDKKAKLNREIEYTDKAGKTQKVKELGLAGAVESFFDPELFRTGRPVDNQLGLEHADAFFYGRKVKELKDEITEEEKLINDYNSPEYTRGDQYSPFWLQDKIRNVSAAINWANIKRYNPALLQYNPYIPQPTPYNPEQEIAASQAAARGVGDMMRGVTGSVQGLGSRLSQTQGDLANIVAKTMGTYNNQNVGVANEFAYKVSDIVNQGRLKNLQSLQNYVDQVNTLNQNYDNAKAQAREEWTNALSDAYTNRAKAQALNSLYPQFHTDPSSGGLIDFVKGRDMIANENALYAQQDADLFAKFLEDHPEIDERVAAMVWTKGKSNPLTPEAAYFNAYSQVTPESVQEMPAGENPNYYMENGGQMIPFNYIVGAF